MRTATYQVVLIAIFLSMGIEVAVAQACFSTSIIKPTPFMGNNDEIFQLADGSIWQVKYEYEYLYEYYPDVIMCPSQGKLIIKNKNLNVARISASPARAVPAPDQPATSAPVQSSPPAQTIESRIAGTFDGWDGNKIYKLQNGQIWQQVDGHYHYHYAYSPEVIIYVDGGSYKMRVLDDDDQSVSVRRLN